MTAVLIVLGVVDLIIAWGHLEALFGPGAENMPPDLVRYHDRCAMFFGTLGCAALSLGVALAVMS